MYPVGFRVIITGIVSDEMRKDINSWLMFLEKFNVVTPCRLVNWSNDFNPILRNIHKVQALLIKDVNQSSPHWEYLGWHDN